jgi:hypothetical protein
LNQPWLLTRRRVGRHSFQLHEPNAASGGKPSYLEIGDFLVRDAHGPQHAELLRLIGTLAGKVDAGGSPI